MKNGNFTEEDLQNAKKSIIAVVNTIEDEQDTGIAYYFGQKINKEEVLKVANKIEINTIYFLRD